MFGRLFKYSSLYSNLRNIANLPNWLISAYRIPLHDSI